MLRMTAKWLGITAMMVRLNTCYNEVEAIRITAALSTLNVRGLGLGFKGQRLEQHMIY